MMVRRVMFIVCVLVLTLGIGYSAHARSADPSPGWTRYVEVRPWAHAHRIHVIVVRTRCMQAEDSAAHLRLREYIDGEAVYGCKRTGY